MHFVQELRVVDKINLQTELWAIGSGSSADNRTILSGYNAFKVDNDHQNLKLDL